MCMLFLSLLLRNPSDWARKMAQLVTCLSCKKVQSPQPTWCMFVIPVLGRWKQEDPWGSVDSQTSRINESQITSQNKQTNTKTTTTSPRGYLKEDTQDCPLISIHTFMYVYMCPYTHTWGHTVNGYQKSTVWDYFAIAITLWRAGQRNLCKRRVLPWPCSWSSQQRGGQTR